jgi:hypothetical protein
LLAALDEENSKPEAAAERIPGSEVIARMKKIYLTDKENSTPLAGREYLEFQRQFEYIALIY